MSFQVSALGVETVICVNCVGQTLGRSGSLAILAAATPHLIFIFDLAKVGAEEMLGAGLGQVLMDESVVKVVHDCRPLEDLLHHQFDINLANVFDTQVSHHSALCPESNQKNLYVTNLGMFLNFCMSGTVFI